MRNRPESTTTWQNYGLTPFTIRQVAPDKLPAIICTSYALGNSILWRDIGGVNIYGGQLQASTNHALNNELWALKSPGFNLCTMYANYGTPGNGWMGTLGENGGFGASNQAWDRSGNGSATLYSSAFDQDYSDPTQTNSTTIDMDMAGQGFTPEESSYQYSTAGWGTGNFVPPADTYYNFPAFYTVQRSVGSSYSLQTGGKAASYQQAVFGLHVTAQNMTHLGTPWPSSVPVSYTNITVMGQPLDSNYNLSVAEPDGVMVPIPVAVSGSSSFVYAFSQPPNKSGSGTWIITRDTLEPGGNNSALEPSGFAVIYLPSTGEPTAGHILLYQIRSVDGLRSPDVDNAPLQLNGAHATNMECPLPPAMTPVKAGVRYGYQDSPSGVDSVWQFTAVAVCRNECEDLKLLSTYYFEFNAKNRDLNLRSKTPNINRDHFKSGMDRYWNGDTTRDSYYPNGIFW
jgi:hypothetical protein